MNIIERYYGSLLGLAVGDALGAHLESKKPGSFKPVNDIIGGGPFNLCPGEWTDDTSMALCLASSLISIGRFDPVDQLSRYLDWLENGFMSCKRYGFGVGRTTKNSLLTFKKTYASFCGPTESNTAGNGSLMRLSPIPLAFRKDPRRAIELSGDSSRTTHQAIECIDSCRFFSGLIVGILLGKSKQEILSRLYCPINKYWLYNQLTTEVKKVAEGSFKKKEPPAIKGSGYVVESLEAALWAFYKSSTFEEGCLKAVNLGNDSDTTGAIYGQLAGAYYGRQNIPQKWLDKLAHYNTIHNIAENLYYLSEKINLQ